MFVLEAVHSAICRVFVSLGDVFTVAVIGLHQSTWLVLRHDRTTAVGAVARTHAALSAI